MTINGIPGSIELYLGEEILHDEGSNLTSLQWRRPDRRLGKYQGGFLNKSELQTQFDKKLRTCEGDPSRILIFDWDGIGAILETVTTAFHQPDAKDILRASRAGGG